MTDQRTPGFSFRTLATSGNARAGILTTPHGEVPTPTFMPVGTQGSVKTMRPAEVAATGARIVLGNTYHLWLRPGPDVVAEMGGLHKFTKWPHAMLTDSGGFQAFSLAERRKTTEEGFVFRSHLDGSKKELSPEIAMRVQGQLGADIAMQLDICPPGDSPRAEVEKACQITTRWARRCLESKRPDQALFGIIQGATHADLRKLHADELSAMPFDGLALGGFSVGEPIMRMHEVLEEIGPKLDSERPHYLMGVGTPYDLVRAIGTGIDMFDCVLPTRNARNGQALLRTGKVVIKQARYKTDPLPLDPTCSCPTCSEGYSRSYLRHLYIAGEILVLRLITAHNLHLYGQLVREAREAILQNRYAEFSRTWLDALASGDAEAAS